MSHPPPRWSVVVPCFERAGTLGRSIASVLAQSSEDLELLVVDDGSNDGSAETIAEFGDRRLRYLYQRRAGVSAARNLGIRHARGSLVTFLDSDDEAMPEWLETLGRGFENPATGVVSAGVRIAETGRDDRIVLPGRLSPLFAGRRLCFLAGALAVRRDLLEAIGGYAPGLGYAENEELALRLIPACLERGLEVRAIDRPLVVYHRDPTPWRRDAERFALMRAGAEYILERHGARLREGFPRGYSNHRGVAAVNAARLGDLTAARRHLAAALRVFPRHWKHYLRWALTFVAPLARRVWGGAGKPRGDAGHRRARNRRRGEA